MPAITKELQQIHDELKQALASYQVGQRVQLSPATDRWMMGDKFGTIVKIGKIYLHVKMDVSKKTIKIHPNYIAGLV